jgi:hypothetical protein
MPDPPSHEQRLKDCSLEIGSKDGLTTADLEWLSSSAGPDMRVVCHGNLLGNSAWSSSPSTLKVPSADAQNALLFSHPISIGTNLIDALLG